MKSVKNEVMELISTLTSDGECFAIILVDPTVGLKLPKKADDDDDSEITEEEENDNGFMVPNGEQETWLKLFSEIKKSPPVVGTSGSVQDAILMDNPTQ